MKRISWIIILLVIANYHIKAQDAQIVKIHDLKETESVSIDFLSVEPVIDGQLDEILEKLPARHFSYVIKENVDTVLTPQYRMAYGLNFFYLYIEYPDNNSIARERAYQFGDGIMLIIAKQMENNEDAIQYYELAFSEHGNNDYNFPGVFFSGINLNRIFVDASPLIKFETHEENLKLGFELLVPWQELKPLHPFINDSIGINVLFTKGDDDPEKFTRYEIIHEERIPFTKRKYASYEFSKPTDSPHNQFEIFTREGHIFKGDSLHLNIVSSFSEMQNDTVNLIFNKSNEQMAGFIECPVSFSRGTQVQVKSVLPEIDYAGSYSIAFESQISGQKQAEQKITVFPSFDNTEIVDKLDALKESISIHTYHTMKFLSKELDESLSDLNYYEYGESEYNKTIDLLAMIDKIDDNIDPFENQRGFMRKAYRSAFDESLQPYVVYLPEDYSPEKAYPLFVFLHGSDMDETSFIEARVLIPSGFIGLCPLGRGKSNGFNIENAQVDINESIMATIDQYAIDQDNIILAGFSMGGYGVLRTHFETPDRFKGLILLSGGPNMGVVYSGEHYAPNFLNEKNLEVFEGIPVFIHHGEKDLNAPFAEIRELADKLNRAGAQVTLISDPQRGHQAPSRDNLAKCFKWINEVIQNVGL